MGAISYPDQFAHSSGAVPMSDPSAPDHLQRSLSNRHLQLIAIGGAIGTGLFMGSGKTISLAGPSILFVYLIIGAMLFFVMRAMGELLLSNLEYKSFIDFSTDLLGPWAGFFCGWTYWFCWIITAIADVIAIAAYAQFWFPGLAPWIPAVLCVLLLLSLNLVKVKLFGEMEFWFALIKIIAIAALIMTGAGLVVWASARRQATWPRCRICGTTAACSRWASADSLPASRLLCSPSSVSSWSAPLLQKPPTRAAICPRRSIRFRCGF